MGLLIMYIVFSSFLIFIMVFVFKKVSKTHTEINTFKIGNKKSTENEKKLIRRDSIINITIYALLIVVTIISMLLYGVQSVENENRYINYLIGGLQFQIVSSILFILLSFLNPFIFFPEKIIEKLKERDTFLKHIIVNNKKSFIIRMLLSVSLISFFVFKKWLTFIPYYVNYGVLQGINILLLLYLFKNLFFMKTNPLGFLKLNILRLVNGVLYIKIFAFVLIPLAPFTMLTLHVLGFDENEFPFWPMLFIVFNGLLILLELKKKQAKKAKRRKNKIA